MTCIDHIEKLSCFYCGNLILLVSVSMILLNLSACHIHMLLIVSNFTLIPWYHVIWGNVPSAFAFIQFNQKLACRYQITIIIIMIMFNIGRHFHVQFHFLSIISFIFSLFLSTYMCVCLIISLCFSYRLLLCVWY